MKRFKNVNAVLIKFIEKHPSLKEESFLTQLNEANISKQLSQDDVSFLMSVTLPEEPSFKKLLATWETLQKMSGTGFGNAPTLLNLIRDVNSSSEIYIESFLEETDFERASNFAV